LKDHENYEKLKENALRTKRAIYELYLYGGHLLPYLRQEEKFLNTSD